MKPIIRRSDIKEDAVIIYCYYIPAPLLGLKKPGNYILTATHTAERNPLAFS
jgi:hypothetical protein